MLTFAAPLALTLLNLAVFDFTTRRNEEQSAESARRGAPARVRPGMSAICQRAGRSGAAKRV